MEGLFVNLRGCDGDRWKGTTTTNSIGQYQFVGLDEGDYYVDFFKPNPVAQYSFTLPMVGGDDEDILDSDVVRLSGNNGLSDCMKVRYGFNRLTNAGYKINEDEVTTTATTTPDPTPKPTLKPISPPPTTPRPTTPEPTVASVPKAPPDSSYSGFCAWVSGEFFDFEGCSMPCTSRYAEDCPDGMKCARTDDC